MPFRPQAKGSVGFFLDLLRNLFSPLPYAIARYQSPPLGTRSCGWPMASDLIVCDFLAPSINVPDGLPAPIVLFQHNVEAVIWQRHVSVPQPAPRRAYFRAQWRRMRRYEAEQCRRFAQVIAVSATDADSIQREYQVASVGWVPTGVDLEYFSASPRPRRAASWSSSAPWTGCRTMTAFAGSRRSFRPHPGSASLARVSPWSADRRRAAMRELAARNSAIEVTGTVADVRPYLERAAICVVPLRIGGGTRLKIYEAMAMGIPVVSTTIGAEGLPRAPWRAPADCRQRRGAGRGASAHSSRTRHEAASAVCQCAAARAGALQLGCGRGALPFPMSPPVCGDTSRRIRVRSPDSRGPPWLGPNR